ncbi:MAG: CcmD family protein [Saprospiraceae bacterium]|nr:CcmD family protein [Saprospiraceae bacterium]
MKYNIAFIMILVSAQNMLAQSSQSFMTSGGKINVVFAVIFIVFIGIIYYLIRIDRKISKLENK